MSLRSPRRRPRRGRTRPAAPSPGRRPGPAIRGSRSPPMAPRAPRPAWLVPLGVAISVGVPRRARRRVHRVGLDDGPSHPDEWDPRVVDLAAFVEDERGLDFDHPVYVDFLTPARVHGGDDRRRRRADEDGRAGRATRTTPGSFAPSAWRPASSTSTRRSTAWSTAARWPSTTPTDERIRVRGTEMTVGLEVTLVHELTHALQDQHFDLDRLNDPELDGGASTAFRALGEGDALRVEDAYIEEELTEEEQAAYDEEYAGELADSEAATSDVPAVHRGALRRAVRPRPAVRHHARSTRTATTASTTPSTSRPTPRSTCSTRPASSPTRDADDDRARPRPTTWRCSRTGPSAPPSWYLVLAERIDPKVAFEAALGWNGDAFAAYEEDGDVCVQAVFAGDTDARTRGDGGRPRRLGGRDGRRRGRGHRGRRAPGIKACDPGESADLELTGRSETSLFLPNLWGYLVADAAAVLDAEQSRCYARAVVDELTYEEITDPEGTAFAGDALPADARRRLRGLRRLRSRVGRVLRPVAIRASRRSAGGSRALTSAFTVRFTTKMSHTASHGSVRAWSWKPGMAPNAQHGEDHVVDRDAHRVARRHPRPLVAGRHPAHEPVVHLGVDELAHHLGDDRRDRDAPQRCEHRLELLAQRVGHVASAPWPPTAGRTP